MFIASTTPPNSWLQRAMAARQVLSDFHIPLTLRLIRHDKKQRQPYAHAPILPASGITRMAASQPAIVKRKRPRRNKTLKDWEEKS